MLTSATKRPLINPQILRCPFQNRVLFGSVNAQRRDWEAAVAGLDAACARWRGALNEFVGLRVPLDRFQEAFDHRGSKATLVLSGQV